MKRVFKLILVFFIILSIIVPSIAITDVYGENLDETTNSKKIGEETKAKVNPTEKVYLDYHVGYTLLKNGRLKIFLDKNRIISEKIQVDHNSIYHFKNLSAKYGNCFYVIYNSNNEVISYQSSKESSTGDVIEEMNLIMPKEAAYFRVACDLNVNNKMFEATKTSIKLNENTEEPAVISFIDDDCRSEVYSVLYPLIKKLDLPYTLACPPNSLDDKDGKYMTTEQVKEVYANGVDIVSHHLKEYAMTEFDSIEKYRKDTEDCLAKFKEMEIEVNGVAYPNGRIKDEYMPVVEEYFKLGFTTDRAINTLPYESSYIHRCEVFPKSGIYNLEDAKALVDSVAENGGWLVFMTHCWFDTFSPTDLEELVEYIRSKNIEISNVTDVMKNYANPIDMGIAKKPLNEMSEDFFIVDCMGRAYTNNIKMSNIEINEGNITEIPKSPIKLEEMSIDYDIMATISPTGKVKDHSEEKNQLSQKKRNVSIEIKVEPNNTYKLKNMSAKYGNCLYAIYDSDKNVIMSLKTADSSMGQTLDETTITMPENAAYLRMACDLNVNDKMFKVYHCK